MPDYQQRTDDELLHLGEERDQLTEDAQLALDGELHRRKLSLTDVSSYKTERLAAENSENLKRLTRFYVHSVGLGMKFLGKTNRQPDPGGTFEKYDTTLWFVALWLPLFPVATYTVRRDFERWWGGKATLAETPMERHPRNWEQILLTWVKASALLLALRLIFGFVERHPDLLRHF